MAHKHKDKHLICISISMKHDKKKKQRKRIERTLVGGMGAIHSLEFASREAREEGCL